MSAADAPNAPETPAAPAAPTKDSSATTTPIVWVDCEMTGLDPTTDALVEIACIVTDAQLNALDEGVSAVIKPPEAALAGMDDFVTNMHKESGLLPLIPEGIAVEEAEQMVLDYVRKHVPTPRKAPLAGSSVYVDRGFLAQQMPALDEYLHYRLIDVSSIKELAKRWQPRLYFKAPEKTGGHRALGDIEDSIEELRYYRSVMMTPAD